MELKNPTKILIIQTAFIGDVILSTVLLEELKNQYPNVKIDFVLRKGNEGVLEGHPLVEKLMVWDKGAGKIRNLFRVISEIRKNNYDAVFNVQRFGSSGLMTLLARSQYKVGYKKNPFSMFFNKRVKHVFEKGKHETSRILDLIDARDKTIQPNLHISDQVSTSVEPYKKAPYITIAPSSVWYTKKLPSDKWVSFLNESKYQGTVYLLGGKSDYDEAEKIVTGVSSLKIENLAGQLSLLESAALMKDAEMNYVNDSAPLHLCSALNAPVTAVFCSTIPEFGFGPLSADSKVVEIVEPLNCRPCGLHGKSECPEGHFNCGNKIEINDLIARLKQRD
ncbi:MAG: glycosyltransferase family 9 protein [bacterium]|nr:glycosyltransferase family 9 protein [bacterium]